MDETSIVMSRCTGVHRGQIGEKHTRRTNSKCTFVLKVLVEHWILARGERRKRKSREGKRAESWKVVPGDSKRAPRKR